VPLVAAAVCPHPPVLVPQIAAGAAAELEALRRACDRAVAELLSTAPDVLILVGAAGHEGRHPLPLRGSFMPWGVDLTFEVGPPAAGDAGSAGLPLSLLIGAWLLSRSKTPLPGSVIVEAVRSTATAGECAALGESFVNTTDSVGLLVMGDGSACRTEKAPGYLDPRAEEFDAVVGKALGGADPAALLAIDSDLAVELMVAGRAPWQVLAGAAKAGAQHGTLLYHEAPYGVNYTVAVWR
jgi:hypothetical protein